MDIDAIMTRQVVTVSMDDNLEKIHLIFAKEHFHHLLVLEDDNTLAGVISDRDFLKAISPNVNKDCAHARDLATLNKKAHQIMSRYPVILRSGDSVEQAVDVLIENGLSCLPIVDAAGLVVGIVSWKDILRFLALLRAPALKTAGSL